MFRKEVLTLRELVLRNLRVQGLETPLLQKRVIDAWPQVAGPQIARATAGAYISNQTLHLHMRTPIWRTELAMRAQEFVASLNAAVGSQVITAIRFA